jgi:hypothetical protein
LGVRNEVCHAERRGGLSSLRLCVLSPQFETPRALRLTAPPTCPPDESTNSLAAVHECIPKASRSEAWERIGIVGDRGDRTVAQMMNGAVEHLAHHLGFVIEKRRALGID